MNISEKDREQLHEMLDICIDNILEKESKEESSKNIIIRPDKGDSLIFETYDGSGEDYKVKNYLGVKLTFARADEDCHFDRVSQKFFDDSGEKGFKEINSLMDKNIQGILS